MQQAAPVTTTLRPEDRRVAAQVPSIACSDSANRQDEPTKVFVNVGEHRTRLVAMTLFSEPREARRRDTAKLLAPQRHGCRVSRCGDCRSRIPAARVDAAALSSRGHNV